MALPLALALLLGAGAAKAGVSCLDDRTNDQNHVATVAANVSLPAVSVNLATGRSARLLVSPTGEGSGTGMLVLLSGGIETMLASVPSDSQTLANEMVGTIVQYGAIDRSYMIAITCDGSAPIERPTPQPPANMPADAPDGQLLSDRRDALGRMLAGARGSTDPQALPRAGEAAQDPAIPQFYWPRGDAASDHAALDAVLAFDRRPVAALPFFSHANELALHAGNMPVRVWTRLKASLLDGSLTRTGAAASAQFGAVAEVAQGLDIGVFGHALAGRVESEVLDGSLSTRAAGLGAHMHYRFGPGFSAGLSATHVWGHNAITLGGSTGYYQSSLWTVAGSLSLPSLEHGGFVIDSGVSAQWSYLTNGAYRDSDGVRVPESREQTLALSALLKIAYPMTFEAGPVVRITPAVGFAAHLHVLRARSLLHDAGFSESALLSASASGSFDVELAGGGRLSLGVGLSGLAADEQAYAATAQFSLPIP